MQNSNREKQIMLRFYAATKLSLLLYIYLKFQSSLKHYKVKPGFSYLNSMHFINQFQMSIKTIQATNILLANIYLIMLIQIASNWNAADCSTGSNLFQLAFILIMICRLAIQEAAFNHILSKQLYKILCFFTSSILLLALGIYQIVNIASNSDAFFYDPKAKVGNEICYQNRIVFVGEIVIIFLTIAKDLYFHVLGQSKKAEEVK